MSSNHSSNIRKRKALTENINIMDVVDYDNELRRKFVVVGTTGSIYDVMIQDKPTCTCLDFTQGKYRCKHIYYILMQVIRTTYLDDETYTNNQVKKLLGIDDADSPNNKSEDKFGDKFENKLEDNSSIFDDKNANIEANDIKQIYCNVLKEITIVSEQSKQSQNKPLNIEQQIRRNVIDDWMDNPIQNKSNYKIVLENIVSNKFSFVPEFNDIISTIGKYIEDNYGIEPKDNALKRYKDNVSMSETLKDTNFAGVYIIQVSEHLYELYTKTIVKINNGWVFNNYKDTIENIKLCRFMVVESDQ